MLRTKKRNKKGFWVARNENGDLYLYHGLKPIKYTQGGYWYSFEGHRCLLDLHMRNIKWTDDEPFKIRFRH